MNVNTTHIPWLPSVAIPLQVKVEAIYTPTLDLLSNCLILHVQWYDLITEIEAHMYITVVQASYSTGMWPWRPHVTDIDSLTNVFTTTKLPASMGFQLTLNIK